MQLRRTEILTLLGSCLLALISRAAHSAPAKLTLDTPLEQRVCRLYFSGAIRPFGADRPRKPFWGRQPEDIADLVADMGVELWQAVDVTGRGVYFESNMVPRNKDVPVEHLARLVKRAHEHGIWLQAGQQLSEMENQDLKGEMEKWAIHPIASGDSKPRPDKQWLSYACKGFEDWTIRHMREHLTSADLDGFWFDATPFAQRVGWPWRAGDIGPEAAAAFKATTGCEAPRKEDWSDPAFRQWVKWRYDTTLNFFQAAAASAKKVKPHAATAMVYNIHNGDWHLGLPLRNVANQDWYPAIHDESSLLGRMGRALSPRAEEWFWAEWYIPQIVHAESPYFDPDRTIAKSLRAAAHGVYPSIGGFSADIELWKDSVKKVFDELGKRRGYVGGESVKHAALVVSQQTRDYRREPTRFWQAVEGLNEIQNRQHILTDVIFDDSLTLEGLAPYPVVILPQVDCLSQTQCRALRSYVRRGGTLVATLGTSLYDEWGKQRDNFALADLFGVDYAGRDTDTQIHVPHDPRLQKQFGRFVSFLAPSCKIKLRDGGGAQALFTRSKMANLNGLSVKREPYDSDSPVIVRRRHGKGSAIYAAAAVDQGYFAKPIPQLARMVAALERLDRSGPITLDESSAVETTAFWRGQDKMIVHLVNCTALAFQTMTPLGNFSIVVNERKLKRATLPLTARELKVLDNRVVVPSIGYGEVLVLDLD
jgi:hypothetical protein